MKIYLLTVTLSIFNFVALSTESLQREFFNQPISTELLSQNSSELIVSFEKLSSKDYQDLDVALSQLEGIRKVGFCEKMNVFYFTYDTNIFHSNAEAFNALIVKTKNFQPLLKIGATTADIQRECNK